MAEDKLDKVKGNIKETVGDATNNDNLEQEGKKDKASGKAKEVIDKLKTKHLMLLTSLKSKILSHSYRVAFLIQYLLYFSWVFPWFRSHLRY